MNLRAVEYRLKYKCIEGLNNATYSIGNYLYLVHKLDKNMGDLYIISQVEAHRICLISIKSGNRLIDPISEILGIQIPPFTIKRSLMCHLIPNHYIANDVIVTIEKV